MNTKKQKTDQEQEKQFQDYKVKTDSYELKVLKEFVEFCQNDFVNEYMLGNELAALSDVILTTKHLLVENEIASETVDKIMNECQLYYYRKFVESLETHYSYPILKDRITTLQKKIKNYGAKLTIYSYEIHGPNCMIILKTRGGKSPEQLKIEIDTVKAWAKSGLFKGYAALSFSEISEFDYSDL